MITISEEDFQRLVHFVRQNYGINLSKKQQLIEGRMNSYLAQQGFKDFHTYLDTLLRNNNPKEIDELLNRLTTNYTYFMREEAHFEFFRKTILPWLEATKRDHVLSIWSAGCSSGQEPYTISMLLKEYFSSKPGNWDTRILATDISQKVLSTAQAGIYDAESLQKIPEDWKRKYFDPVSATGQWAVKPSLKSNVIFKTFNLMDQIRFRRKFDVIFCRNVMIYFDQPTKDALVRRFYDATNPGGYLLIGHSESLNKTTTPYQYIMPAVYRKQSQLK